MAKVTSNSLKKQNRLPLAGILTVNFAAFMAVAHGGDLVAGLQSASLTAMRGILPAGAGLLVATLLNSQLSATAKARLVFMKWRNPLPGSRAFTFYAKQDDRVNYLELSRRFGPLPSTPKEENALWYKLYRSVEDQAPVNEANQQFLLWRDGSTLVLLIIVLLVPLAGFLIRQIVPVASLLALLGLEFGLMLQAARIHGERLVSNVLALKSAEEASAR